MIQEAGGGSDFPRESALKTVGPLKQCVCDLKVLEVPGGRSGSLWSFLPETAAPLRYHSRRLGTVVTGSKHLSELNDVLSASFSFFVTLRNDHHPAILFFLKTTFFKKPDPLVVIFIPINIIHFFFILYIYRESEISSAEFPPICKCVPSQINHSFACPHEFKFRPDLQEAVDLKLYGQSHRLELSLSHNALPAEHMRQFYPIGSFNRFNLPDSLDARQLTAYFSVSSSSFGIVPVFPLFTVIFLPYP